ncbi:MAG TPA: phospholipase D family protein [Methanofastidiosum sp.]|nr:phospholipase D family protein [Methanofastidiosum sp.]
MKTIEEIVNGIFDSSNKIELNKFKSILLKEINNRELIDILLEKGTNEGNFKIDDNSITLINKFKINKIKSSIELCISIPPFEKVALDRILEVNRINIINIEGAFKTMIKNSKESIKICSPFFEYNGWKRLEYEFVDYLKKGGKIKIICRNFSNGFRNQNDKNVFINYLDSIGFRQNIEFREYHFERNHIESSTHAKLFITDKNEAYIGSGEIRKNSFDTNFEMGVLLKGDIVKDIERVFDYMFDSSQKVEYFD